MIKKSFEIVYILFINNLFMVSKTQLMIYLEPSEKEEIKAISKRLGIRMGTYVKSVLFRDILKFRVEVTNDSK